MSAAVAEANTARNAYSTAWVRGVAAGFRDPRADTSDASDGAAAPVPALPPGWSLDTPL